MVDYRSNPVTRKCRMWGRKRQSRSGTPFRFSSENSRQMKGTSAPSGPEIASRPDGGIVDLRLVSGAFGTARLGEPADLRCNVG